MSISIGDDRARSKSHAQPASVEEPLLPASRAFIVQFVREDEVNIDALKGRVEHVVSGKSLRFGDVDDLLAFIRATLVDGGQPPR